MTWNELVKEYFPGISEEEVDYILWEHTGFPAFWLPKDGNTPEECCRTQLQRFKDKSLSSQSG